MASLKSAVKVTACLAGSERVIYRELLKCGKSDPFFGGLRGLSKRVSYGEPKNCCKHDSHTFFVAA